MTDTIRTERLTLRPLQLSDVDDLWPHTSDPELPRFMTWEHHKHRDETAQFVARTVAARADERAYVWTVREGDAFRGLVGLHDVTRQQLAWRMDRGELGYWMGAPFRSRGFTTEAARAAVRFGFEELGLHKVTVGCVKENEPSVRIIERLGFRLVGVQREHFFRFERWWDHVAYEMLVSEWRASPAHTPGRESTASTTT